MEEKLIAALCGQDPNWWRNHATAQTAGQYLQGNITQSEVERRVLATMLVGIRAALSAGLITDKV